MTVNTPAEPSHHGPGKAMPEDETGSIVIFLARCGYAAKGVTYLALAAAVAAIGVGFRSAFPHLSTSGMVVALLGNPWGPLVLLALIFGFFAFGMWLCYRRVCERRGDAGRDLWQRAGYLLRGVGHVALSLAAIGVLWLSASPVSAELSLRRWTARLMGVPYGPVLVGLAGLMVLVMAAVQCFAAVKPTRPEEQKLLGASPGWSRVGAILGRCGLAARGVLFLVMGLLLFLAAFQQDPRVARGFRGIVRLLTEQALGAWLVGAITLGLLSWAILHLLIAWRFKAAQAP
jgi:hypothetical protein